MSNYVASIDFGSAKIALAIGEQSDNGIRIVSYHEAEAVGISNGEIIKDRQVVETVKDLIGKAEEDIQEKISEVTVGLSGKTLKSKTVSCSKLRSNPDSYIDEKELSEITRGRYNSDVEYGEAIFDAIPQSYNLDEYLGISHEDIAGRKGRQIEASYYLVYGKDSILSRRLEILNACSLKAKKAILSPIASARAVLTAQEMENGAVLVDIGKGTTEIAIVKDNIVKAVATIPFAGESVTKDIKNVANVTAKWAEDVKMLHGCCCAEFTPENKKLILRGQDNMLEGEIELPLLSEVIEARMSEIFEAVRYIVDQSGYADKLAGGVVLTGGTAYMEYIQQLAKAFMGQKVKLAAPRNSIAYDSVTEAFDAYSSTAVGLVLETISPMLSYACMNDEPKAASKKQDDTLPKIVFEPDEPSETVVEKKAEKDKDEDERERRNRLREEQKQREREEKERIKAQKAQEKEKRKKDKEGGIFSMLFGDNNDKA